MKKLYMGTNTKMYKGIHETAQFVGELKKLTEDIPRELLELFVIPSFTAIEAAGKAAGNALLIGAQNMGWEEYGQYTGEISPLMLREAGASLVMAGHSERRHIFAETDLQENKKVCCALDHGFRALLCVGETGEQKELGISDEMLAIQLKTGLYGLSAAQAQNLWIAYEPVWAIGVQGKPASKEYVQQRHAGIRKTLETIFGRESAVQIPVLYGGSVNRENACSLIACSEVDGLFIGRSAWDAENFNRIIRDVIKDFPGKEAKEV